MLSYQKPSSQTIGQFLEEQRRTNFSYVEVGATTINPPADYVVDRTRVKLGNGEQTFVNAKAALERWDQFRLGWVEAHPADTPIQQDAVLVVVAYAAKLWWLNACRIVYVVDKGDSIRRFGFAYGTLAKHVERGEERFLIEWDRADDSVWYESFAFSRPRHILAQVGYPWVRQFQKRFARESAEAMQRAVDASFD